MTQIYTYIHTNTQTYTHHTHTHHYSMYVCNVWINAIPLQAQTLCNYELFQVIQSISN